ncbi:MAG: zinc ribbon domain-containing protein [Clostridia bacterium]|nr:zinc ribbon domain-containing protein [Clostridia bacterium]
MFCKKCGKEIMDDAIICVHCGCSAQENQTIETAKNDAPSAGMGVLGFFIPLAGFIIWLINKDSKPLMAKSAGKGALIGVICSIVFSIIYGIIVGSMVGSMLYY